MSRLDDVHGIIGLGLWMQRQGYTVGEGPGRFGPVDPDAHTPGSLHYVGRALDVNHGASGPEEHTRLKALYDRILTYRRHHPKFPLDEMFYDGFGFLKELGPGVNHAISGHDTHLHIGVTVKRW